MAGPITVPGFCRGVVIDTLEAQGYERGELAMRVRGMTAGDVTDDVRSLCGAGVPIPEAGAKTVVDFAVPAGSVICGLVGC